MTLSSFDSLFPQTEAFDPQTWRLTETIALAADDRKAADITVLRVTEVSYLADYFVLATGFSRIQVRAIADAIEKAVRETLDRSPLRSEGAAEGSWVVQDYGEVIVHIFQLEAREFYNLEAFWGHAQRVEIPQLQSTSSFKPLP
jgi:ribosome-associated protein